MTTYERLEALRNSTNLDADNAHEVYPTVEAELVNLFADQIKNAEIITTAWGTGKVTEASGETIDSMFMTVVFANDTKRFAVEPIISGKAFFTKFVENEEIKNAWNEVLGFHTELTRKYIKIKNAEIEAAREAVKKAAADLKAAEKYERQKAKALKDFETMATQEKEVITQADEFYYSLGWLAKHASNVAAVLPDYLADAFTRYFGSEAPCRVVDSKHRGPAGWQAQWSWSFTISLKKPELVPAFLSDKLNPAGKAVSKTSFVWDLVENYGFQFGKKQDIDKIRSCIPSEYIDSFELALA